METHHALQLGGGVRPRQGRGRPLRPVKRHGGVHVGQLVDGVQPKALDDGRHPRILAPVNGGQLVRECVYVLDGGGERCEVARIARQEKPAMTGFRVHQYLLELDDADPLFVRTLQVGRGLREPGAAELSNRVQRDDEFDG